MLKRQVDWLCFPFVLEYFFNAQPEEACRFESQRQTRVELSLIEKVKGTVFSP